MKTKNFFHLLSLKTFSSTATKSINIDKISLRHNLENALFFNKVNQKEKFLKSFIDFNKHYPKEQSAVILFNESLKFYLKNHDSFNFNEMLEINQIYLKNNNGDIKQLTNLSKYFRNFYRYELSTKKPNNKENVEKNIKILTNCLTYYKIASENSILDPDSLEFIVKFFTDNKHFFNNKNVLIDFLWLTCFNFARFAKENKVTATKNIQLIQNIETLVNMLNTMLGFKGELTPSLTAENAVYVRLYKSLYYILHEPVGIVIPDELLGFMKAFRSFFKMNMEVNVQNSALEDAFAAMLDKMNLHYVKEKKFDFGVVDFFVGPDRIFEVNGPDHYVFNSSVVKGKYVMKRRIFELKGFIYRDIDYRDMKSDPNKLVKELQEEIEKGKKGGIDQLGNTMFDELQKFKELTERQNEKMIGSSMNANEH